MTTAVQRRRGTNTEHASFTGLEGEISVNTTNESVHVHDGSTAGGFELMRADGANSTVSLGDITGVTAGTGLSGGGTTGTVTLDIDGTVATLAGTQTFTNKTLTSPILNTPTIGTSFTIGGATITEAELEILDGATVTTTELNYVDGVTSAIQTQIDAKAPLASPSFTVNLDVISTDAGSDAGPEFTLFRNSSSPADGDYLGQVKFDGKSDTGVTRVYAKISGKTSDVSNGTEDGLIETAVKSNGSNVIVSRQTGDALKLINGTGLEVAGNITVDGTVDGRDVATDGTKLDGIEASADVTDTANVTAAGALMDSELTSEASVKALDQGVATTDSPAFAGLTVDTTTLAVDSTNNRVGIGTSSPSRTLHSKGGSGVSTTGKFEAGGSQVYVQLSSSGQADGDSGYIGYDSSKNLTLFTDNTERMRIDSSGNVGIGTSSPTSTLHVNSADTTVALQLTNSATGSAETDGFIIGVGTGGFTTFENKQTSGIAFNIAGSEVGRFAGTGHWLVGRTGTGTGAEEDGVVLNPNGLIITAKDGTSSQTHINFINNAAVTATSVGTIKTSGSATSYNTSSDYRLKENIADADDAGSKIDSIQVRKYDWKADGSHQDYGMIAQELLEVAPEAVSVPEDSEEMMGVDYSKLVPMLIKEIQSLRGRVNALEAE